jgi:lipoprotein-anchoring transpeptidase ErfK/SrfK
MRRICMPALLSALSTGALSASAISVAALADPLQLSFSSYAMSGPVQQPAYVVQPQMQAAAPASAQQYSGRQYYVYTTPQQGYASAPQGYAVPQQGYAAAPRGFVSAQPQSYAQAAPSYTGTVAPRYASAAPAPVSYAAPAPATYAAPAPQAPPPPAPSHRGFLEQIFGGPTIQAHVYAPAMPEYQQAPAPVPDPAAVNQQQAYAPSGQGNMAAYPVDPKYDRQVVDYRSDEAPGTIVIDTPNKFLYLVEGGGKAMRYGIGVGRPGFTWAGVKTISAKKEWPDWRPPSDMLERRPDLPRYMPGGVDNPLGARAMYLGSTLYRIHGSNEPWTIGTNVSSGCIRMRNEDVTDLYERVRIGTKVVVI